MQPVFMLMDTSGSMSGEPIAAVNVGLSSLLSTIRSRPGLAEKVHLSLQTFDGEIKNIVQLQPASQLASIPTLTVPGSGPTFLGEALEAFLKSHAQIQRTSQTLPAMLFVMTDGSPTDLQVYRDAIPKVHALGLKKIVAFAAGPKAKREPLEPLADEIFTLDTLDGHAFSRMFTHMSDLIEAPQQPSYLPPPPDEIIIEL